MAGIYKTEGIIIKRKNFGEADKILTIFTKHYGKIKAIAKGIRKITSKKAGILELFNHCKLVLARGKDLDIITEAEVINNFFSLMGSLNRVGVAWYFCELVDKLTAEGQANKDIFELLKNYLENIGEENTLQYIRSFEEHLLNQLGFGIPLQWRRWPGSLKPYIESIAEKEIQTPKILLNNKK
jgi:DNA repair protein RecO (recombination protein O)